MGVLTVRDEAKMAPIGERLRSDRSMPSRVTQFRQKSSHFRNKRSFLHPKRVRASPLSNANGGIEVEIGRPEARPAFTLHFDPPPPAVIETKLAVIVAHRKQNPE